MSGYYNLVTGKPREWSRGSQKSTATYELVYKSLNFATKAVDEPKGLVTAAVGALDVVDLQKDVIHRNSWTPLITKMQTRSASWPSILVNHDWSQGVGVVTNAWEGEDMLYIDARFNMKTSAGRDAFENTRMGVYGQWSVGFVPGDKRYDDHGIAHITSIESWPETSLVLVGAAPNTRTLAVKGWPFKPRQSVEDVVSGALRDVAAELGIPVDEAARRFVENQNKAPEPIQAPSDQPFGWELEGERGREWRWDEEAKRYVRRVAPSTWGHIKPPAPRPAGESEPFEESLQRWVRGALPGQLPQSK